MSEAVAARASTGERPDVFDLSVPATAAERFAQPERLQELIAAAGMARAAGVLRFGAPEAPERLLVVFDDTLLGHAALACAVAGLTQHGRCTELARHHALIGLAAGLSAAGLATALDAFGPTIVIRGTTAAPVDAALFSGAGLATVEYLYLTPQLERALWRRTLDVWRPLRWLGRPTFRRGATLLRHHPDYRLGLLARRHVRSKDLPLFGSREHLLHAVHPEALPGLLPIGEGRFLTSPLSPGARRADAPALGQARTGAVGLTGLVFRPALDECIAAWLALAEGALLARLEHRDEPARRARGEG
jgi:hypothetical protein